MKKAVLFLIIIFSINIIGIYFGWYQSSYWFDSILHFGGGFFVAMFMADYLKNILSSNEKLKTLIILVSTVMLVGVLWEFAEYTAQKTLSDLLYDNFRVRIYFMGDLWDTMLDLFMDLAGALVFGILYILKLARSRHTSFN